MAVTGIKFDDGSMSHARNCFPVRGLMRQTEEGDGAWLVAHRAEQRKQFKAVLCAKPLRTYSRLREERKKTERKNNKKESTYVEEEEEEPDDGLVLDGFYLMKHCCVEDPADLCSINITGEGLSEVKEDDFVLFDNVAYVNAGENFLPLEAFRGFSLLRELELPLNGLRNLHYEMGWFESLEMLDVSYNNLSSDDITTLGMFPNIRVLHLTGNNLKTLPPDMSRVAIMEKGEKIQKFAKLEMLMLDDNRLSEETAFAALAGLRNLRQLNLQRNQIHSVPQLRLVDNQHVQQNSPVLPRKDRKSKSASSRRSSGRKSAEREEQLKRNSETVVPEIDVANIMAEEKVLTTPAEESGERPDVPMNTLVRSDLDTDRNLMTERTRKKREEQDVLMMDSFRSLHLEDPGVSLIDSERAAADPIPEEGAEAEEEEEDFDEPLPPPFPELRYLDVSHNLISQEEDLLAVAAWPMLSELVIHDNPLTTQRKGDPPLLTRFLSKRLGITLQRKKPTYTKPHIEVPTGKPSRQVKLVVPPIPKVNVEELLMLEAPQPASIEEKRPASGQSLASNAEPLPPIIPQDEMDESPASEVEDVGQQEVKEDNGDTFFMTQVDEPATDRAAATQPPPVVTEERMPTPPKMEKPGGKTRRKKVAEKYKGYELLLDVEDDPGVVIPTDIQGNVRALDFTLKHPIKFRDNEVVLDRHQKPYKPFVMKHHGQGPAPHIKTKQEKIGDVIENAKNRETFQEADLREVLSKQGSLGIKKKFPEAKTLLSEVQREFEIVRVLRTELKRYLDAHINDEFVTETIDELQSCLPALIRDAVIAHKHMRKEASGISGPAAVQHGANGVDEGSKGGSSTATQHAGCSDDRIRRDRSSDDKIRRERSFYDRINPKGRSNRISPGGSSNDRIRRARSSDNRIQRDKGSNKSIKRDKGSYNRIKQKKSKKKSNHSSSNDGMLYDSFSSDRLSRVRSSYNRMRSQLPDDWATRLLFDFSCL